MRKKNEVLPRIVVLGGGLGDTIAAYEIAAKLRRRARVEVISDSPRFSFVPSNPWVAVSWRDPEATQVELAPIFARRGIGFTPVSAERGPPAGEPRPAKRRPLGRL